jgi:hypothetical protein
MPPHPQQHLLICPCLKTKLSDHHEIRLQQVQRVHDDVKVIAAMRVDAEPPEGDSFGVDRYSGVICFRLNP